MMSRGSGDDPDGQLPQQPREWFAVLFGSRLLRLERNLVNHFADTVKNICLEEGLLLTDRPCRSAIIEDDNIEYLVADIRAAIDGVHQRHPEGFHMPLVLVINDQTLLELHDDYIVPQFSDDAWIYSLKSSVVKEFVAVDEWGQIRTDVRQLIPLVNEYNRLGPLPLPVEEERPEQRAFRDRDIPAGVQMRSSSSQQHHQQHRRPAAAVASRRDPGGYQEPARSPPSKMEMCESVVASALANVREHPKLLDQLAEDMAANIDYAHIRELPRDRQDLLAMLRLFVLAAESKPPKQTADERKAGAKLRKAITETTLNSGLLKAVRDEYVGGLHERVVKEEISNHEMRQAGGAIALLLRTFVLLSTHDLIVDEALDIWGQLESPVFGLPGPFWRALAPGASDEMCKLAADVTTNDPTTYLDVVRKALDDDGMARGRERATDSAPSPPRREAIPEDGRTRRPAHAGAAAGPSSSYKYDPYDLGDESDTSDGRFDGVCTPTEDDLVDERDYGNRRGGRQQRDWEAERREEERRAEEQMRLEEERRRQAEEREAQRLREAEEAMEYERRRHHQALQQQEAKHRWENNETPIQWREHDGSQPDVSYRKLAHVPVYSDLYKPKAPYMRRAVVSGAYSDSEHYLDVQFRLMREDMVAPLRDGIYGQKIITDHDKLIASSNDLKIYPTIQVGALQVRSIDGLPMRIVNIPQHMLFQIREERQLKFGQCVVISSDKFNREFHIGWICDRFQEPGMAWQGRLAISFFDECQPVRSGAMPIDKTATFALAESPSYLEAYRHVLRVIKKMRQNVVFPLERYLVHMKKNTRFPQYMRSKEKEEDKQEDKERQILYAKKISEAQRKEKEGEKKKKDGSRSGSRSPNEEGVTSEEHVTTEEGVSAENVVDDGFNTDEEDSFLTGGRAAHPNPKDLDTISIRGKSYSVEKLEEEFQTEALDETQRKAMCYALTSELAIIQGPPGTGKTHIGVEIVMAILENRIKWRMTEPILIVTFSNQALDHFLDKVRTKIEERGLGSEDAPSVVRLGSRSEHDGIKLNCLLATVMKDYEEDLAGEAANERMKARKTKQAWLSKLMRAVKTVQISRKSIMQYNTIRQLMDPNHEMQLRQAAYGMRDSSGNPLNMDEVLVSWLLNKTYERKRDLPPGSDDSSGEETQQWGAGGGAGRALHKKPAAKEKRGGRETKKEKNERKRQERRNQWREGDDSSDTEEEDEQSPAFEMTDVYDEEEEDEDNLLKEMLKKINDRASKQQSTMANEEKWRRLAEKYEMDDDWEVEKEYAARNNGRMLVDDVEIFSRTTKPSLIKSRNGKDQVNVDPNIVRDIHEHKQYILSKEAFTEEEVKAIKDVRTLTKEQRWRLLTYWQDRLASFFRNSLDDYVLAHERACTAYEAASDVARAMVLRRALIIGATTTGSAKRRALVARIAPKVLVVEEAAEVLEAHLLASIVPSVQHAIFIGDHQQLRPSTAVHALAKLANMEVSLFERLVKNGYPFHTLGLQHRMLAPLTKLVVKPFFYNKLQDAPSIFEYPSVAGMGNNLFFWAHTVAEDTVNDSMSKRNIVEAEMCRNLANYILLQGQYRPQEITIIGMYGAQVQEIKRSLQGVGGSLGDVAVETVDSFQGKENRVMILSLVRSRSGGVGFLAIANRITVALTRAQHGMYVVGNFADIAQYSDMWNNIVHSLNDAGVIDYALPVVCQRHGHESKILTNQHFIDRTPFGGCTDRCGYLMNCGHTCKNICHPPHQHERFVSEGPNLECKEVCRKPCDKCQTPCAKRCQEPCGTCHAIVTIELEACGHQVRCECGARNLARCKEPCTVTLACGHDCQNRCSVECVTVQKCEQGVPFVHPICKHSLVLPCNAVLPWQRGEVAQTPACYEKCPERLVCGHKCPRNCGEPCPTMCETEVTFVAPCGHTLKKKCSDDSRHIKCPALVDSDMPHCSHRIKMECYQSRNQNECRSACKKPTSCGHECSLSCGACFKKASSHECSARCTRDLPCGHRCQGTCGKPCVCLSGCRVRCVHQRCGPMTRDKGGPLSYGRACAQPCVLCTEPCDNHCEHRACSKKCFEECDVKAPCSKPCSKLLRCGHGCLGLCGEICPKLCGTCSTAQYKTLIERFPDEEPAASGERELPRLIEMPACEHIFPYKYVDKQVKDQIAAGNIVLKCPRCSGQIEDCKRYIKQTKRLWAEADSRKWEKRMGDLEMSRAELMGKYGEMRNLLTTRQDEVNRFQKIVFKGGRNDGRFAMDAFRALDSLFTVLRPALAQADSRNEYFYWLAVLGCHASICGLVLDYIQKAEILKVEQVLDMQPNLRAVMEEAFDRRRSRLFPMRDQFRSMVDVVKESLEYRRVGQLVPQFRAAMLKSHLYYHMELLNATMRGKPDERGEMVDLTMLQASTYRRVIKQILKDSPCDHPQQKLEDMMAKIHADVYGKILRTDACSLKTFKVPLPEF